MTPLPGGQGRLGSQPFEDLLEVGVGTCFQVQSYDVLFSIEVLEKLGYVLLN